MERSYLLLLGALSGLVSVLLHAVCWSLLVLIRPATARDTHVTSLDIPDILLHVASGTGLGLFFWLSWGLAAIVDVPWWTRGLAFAALAWGVTTAPALLSLARSRGSSGSLASSVALQWATTCVIAGLACAWSWAKMG